MYKHAVKLAPTHCRCKWQPCHAIFFKYIYNGHYRNINNILEWTRGMKCRKNSPVNLLLINCIVCVCMCLMHITYTPLAQNNGTGWMSALTYSNLCVFIPVPDDTKSQIHTASSFISAELLFSLRCWMTVRVCMALSLSPTHIYLCVVTQMVLTHLMCLSDGIWSIALSWSPLHADTHTYTLSLTRMLMHLSFIMRTFHRHNGF